MPSVSEIVRWEVQLFLLGLVAMVAHQLLTGQINTRRLLYGRMNDTGQPILDADGTIRGRKREDTPYFSPARVQLLLATLGAAFYYLTQVLNNPNPGTFPPFPDSWPAVLGASNAIYLGGKAYSRLFAGKGDSK